MTAPDFRPNLQHAQQWVGELIAGVRPDQLAAPTPCDDFDVRQLIEHLLAVQERIRRMGVEGTISDAPTALRLSDDFAAEFRSRASEAEQAWTGWSADELWHRTVVAPFGTVPGGVAVMIYASENLTHGWDLAIATGQESEADAAMVAPVLGGMKQGLPAEPRGGEVPFDPPVEPAEDAGPTEQLANWCGRAR